MHICSMQKLFEAEAIKYCSKGVDRAELEVRFINDDIGMSDSALQFVMDL